MADEPHGMRQADQLGAFRTGNDGVNSAGREEWVDDGIETGEGGLEVRGPDGGERDVAARVHMAAARWRATARGEEP